MFAFFAMGNAARNAAFHFQPALRMHNSGKRQSIDHASRPAIEHEDWPVHDAASAGPVAFVDSKLDLTWTAVGGISATQG